LPSCSGGRIDPFDLDTGATLEEAFDTVLKNRDDEKKSNKASENKSPKETPIPKLSKLIVSPPPPSIGGDKVISFSVTDQVPLKDVLIEFGRMVKIDVDIDPAISGGIILNAKNRPLKEVIDRIAGDSTIWEQEPLRGLAADRQLTAYHHTGFWQPMDTLRDRHHLEELWAQGQALWKVW
jgi:hypothetical protein